MINTRDESLAPWDRRYSVGSDDLPVELITLDDLRRRRIGDDLLQRPGRVFFHVAVVCTDGEGLHEVDFSPVALRSRRVIHVRPGQVHRWRFARPYEATLVFFPDTPRLRGSGWPVGPRWFDLDDSEWTQTIAVLDLMKHEVELQRPPERRNLALSAALELLIVNLGLDLPRQQETAHLPPPYVELVNQIEDDPDWSRSVTQRARRLGYSQRTLRRACIAATGRTAKQIIDDRVLLEAQRLLADDDTPVASIARQLGFTEPATFTRFFHRLTGDNPATWRQHTRPPSPATLAAADSPSEP